MSKRQISAWLPVELVELLDDYLMRRQEQTGRLNHRAGFIREAIIEKLAKEDVIYED